MRITERTGLIYTALFLTVSVAVITQNADALMSAFRGETSVQAVDDIFTVHAGRDQRLLVLRNDVDPQKAQSSQITLIGQPACGTITQTGGSFTYSGSATCTGHQAFSYCLNTGLDCQPASVALRVIEAREPVSSVARGPAVETSGFETQVSFNNRELEITNVHLGRVAPAETTAIVTSGAKLARVAIDTKITMARPEPIGSFAKLDGTFTMEDMVKPSARIDTSTLVEVAATTEMLSDASPQNANAAQRMPLLPITKGAVFPKQAGSLTARMVKIDMGFHAPEVMVGIDQSPFGTPCSVTLNSIAVEGGMVELDLNAPCLPNSRVEIRHGKLKTTLKTDHIGNLNVEVPAFETNAHFLVYLANGAALKAVAQVPELEHIDRVAIQWRGDFEVDLHALEFGATRNSRGHIWQGQPGAIAQSERFGGGYVVRLGDNSFDRANMIEVYSLPLSPKTKTGIIDFSVSALPKAASCEGARVIQSLRSRGGRLVGASGVAFNLPACGENNQSIVLKNVVRDLIIASR